MVREWYVNGFETTREWSESYDFHSDVCKSKFLCSRRGVGASQLLLRRRNGSFPTTAQEEEEWELPNCCPGDGVGASQQLLRRRGGSFPAGGNWPASAKRNRRIGVEHPQTFGWRKHTLANRDTHIIDDSEKNMSKRTFPAAGGRGWTSEKPLAFIVTLDFKCCNGRESRLTLRQGFIVA